MSKMYFLAIVAPENIEEDITTWKVMMKERFDCLVALRSPAHITLVPPFWMQEPAESQLEELMEKLSKRRGGFEIQLQDFGAFKPRVIYVNVLNSETLRSLQSELENLLGEKFYHRDKGNRSFQPHVTIATRDLRKKSFHEAWEIFEDKKYEAAWRVNGLSLLRHNGTRWDVIFTSNFI